MKFEYYKMVLMPIYVPVGNYCFGDKRICEHFDSEGGTPACTLNFYPLKTDKEGRVLKPPKCQNLKPA